MEIHKEFRNFSAGFGTQKAVGMAVGQKYKNIVVNGSTIRSGENNRFKGIGCISANNSSRLLLDYKELNPKAYDEILRLLFDKNYGIGLSHIKLELGADINSSSGTEPSTMRSESEKADVRRGAGFIFAADALKINPSITVDLLRWGQPAWVKKAFDVSRENGFRARYKWYADTIRAAYNELGIRFTHISPDANETQLADTEWLIYFAENLRADTSIPYDTKEIKIVASDEVGGYTIAAAMLENPRLMAAVDIIGLHYTTCGDENTARLHSESGKEIWYSEGSAPMNNPQYTVKCSMNGLGGRNGAVDIANRIINSAVNGKMTMYELQPAVASYYDGSCYFPKQIIRANEPWSGHFAIGSGLYTLMHFTRFIGENMYPVESASFGDGDENHYIENTTDNYVTFMNADKSDFTMILTNDSAVMRSYSLSFENCDFNGRSVSIAESCGPAVGNIFPKTRVKVISKRIIGEDRLKISVKPCSVLTVTTLDTAFTKHISRLTGNIPVKGRLTLPFCESFDFSEDFISLRGGTPLFTTDQGGAFEAVRMNGEGFLVQKITKELIPDNWRFRGTPEPLTCLGDDSWADYSAQISIMVKNGYAGMGVRYNSAVACPESSLCGFSVKLYADGKCRLMFMNRTVDEIVISGFDSSVWHTLKIDAEGSRYCVKVDGTEIGGFTEKSAFQTNGRISLLSSYDDNCFRELTVSSVKGGKNYADRVDALSEAVTYSGNPNLSAMEPYEYSSRTNAVLHAGDSFKLSYCGGGFALCGSAERAEVSVMLDGKCTFTGKLISSSHFRQAFLRFNMLKEGRHTLVCEVLSGNIVFDSAVIYTDRADYCTIYASDFDRELKREKYKKAAAAALGVTAAVIARKSAEKRRNK